MNRHSEQKDFSRHMGTGMTIMAWIIFLALLALFFNHLLDTRNNPNQHLATASIAGNREVVLQRNPYGHYVATGKINGHPVTFLLDTGASDIAIPASIAQTLKLAPGPQIQVQTANGVALAERTFVHSISLGDITLHDLPATILHHYRDNEVLLGMSFLKQLELVQKGNTLTIRQSP